MGIHSVGTSDAALVRRVQTGDAGAYASEARIPSLTKVTADIVERLKTHMESSQP